MLDGVQQKRPVTLNRSAGSPPKNSSACCRYCTKEYVQSLGNGRILWAILNRYPYHWSFGWFSISAVPGSLGLLTPWGENQGKAWIFLPKAHQKWYLSSTMEETEWTIALMEFQGIHVLSQMVGPRYDKTRTASFHCFWKQTAQLQQSRSRPL